MEICTIENFIGTENNLAKVFEIGFTFFRIFFVAAKQQIFFPLKLTSMILAIKFTPKQKSIWGNFFFGEIKLLEQLDQCAIIQFETEIAN